MLGDKMLHHEAVPLLGTRGNFKGFWPRLAARSASERGSYSPFTVSEYLCFKAGLRRQEAGAFFLAVNLHVSLTMPPSQDTTRH